MVRSMKRWFVVLAVVSSLPAAAVAQAPASASEAPPPDRPPAYVLPPAGPIEIPPFPRPDPLLDRPNGDQPGFYVNSEVQYLFDIRVRNQLSVPVTSPVTGGTDIVGFPGNQIDMTVMPRFEIGYRLPDGWGALEFDFRFLSTQGSNSVAGPTGPGVLDGRLDTTVLDFGYASQEFSLGPQWDMRWGAGARMATIYFNNNLTLADGAPAPGDVLFQSDTNSMRAYGAYGNLEIGRRLAGIPGLTVSGKVEFADMYGRIKQTASEVLVGNDGSPTGSFYRQDGGVGPPMFSFRTGVTWNPPSWRNVSLQAGYSYETWFDVGRLNDSRAQLDMQGFYLRAEIGF